MSGRHSSHYEAQAQTVNFEYITSSDDNAAILQKLRDNDPEFTTLGIRADYPDDEDDFTIAWGDDMGWLGFFVAKNSTLQSLYIDINDTPESEFLSILDRIGVFIEGLNRNRSIEKLHIGSDLGSENFRRMGDFFSNNNNLRELSFGNLYTMGIDSARSIAHMLSRCCKQGIRKISFQDSEASDVVLAEIIKAISNYSKLEELDLDGNNLGREGCVALGNALKVCRNPQLQNLYLCYNDNGIDDVGLSSLVTGLRNCRNLTKLALGGNQLITVGGFRSLSTLFRPRCRLKYLILDNMNIDDGGIRALAAGMANLHLLEEFHLCLSSIGDDGATALAAGLVNLRSLKKLHLSGNSIGDEGVSNLAPALARLRLLEGLFLYNNLIGDDGISALAPTLASLQSLEELFLSNNSIGDEGLQALVEGISHCSNLSELALEGNQTITASGLTSLSALLRSDNCSLIRLSLREINFCDDMATALANGLEGNKSLKKLHFNPQSTGLTSVGWSAFSKLLCDTSSVNNIYLSNHTLEIIGNWSNSDNPDDVKHFLALNRHTAKVAIQKILESHPDFDVESMFQWKLKLLPHVISTLERVRTPIYVFDEDQDVLVSKYSGQTLRRKLQSMKLSTVYKFVRGMPLVVVEVDAYRRYIEAALLAPIPRKRNFEQLYD